MTREEFERDVNSWDDLKDFCWSVNCEECDDIESEDTYNDWIEENVVAWAREESWQDLLAILGRYDNNTGYGWYIWSDYDSEYLPAEDDDFFEHKSRVLEWGDNQGIWDEEEQEEDAEDDADEAAECDPDPDPIDPEDIDPTPEEECSFGDIIYAATSCIRTIREEVLERERQQGKAYADFMSSVFNDF